MTFDGPSNTSPSVLFLYFSLYLPLSTHRAFYWGTSVHCWLRLVNLPMEGYSNPGESSTRNCSPPLNIRWTLATMYNVLFLLCWILCPIPCDCLCWLHNQVYYYLKKWIISKGHHTTTVWLRQAFVFSFPEGASVQEEEDLCACEVSILAQDFTNALETLQDAHSQAIGAPKVHPKNGAHGYFSNYLNNCPFPCLLS